MVKRIELTQGQHALVDDQDFDFLMQWKWHAVKTKSGFYAGRTKREKGVSEPIRVYMHRQLMKPSNELSIDHINGNTLDNTKQNLRIVTHRQNHQNRTHGGSSKYPGVCWRNDIKKWYARISVNGKQKYLGVFNSEREAFEAYKIEVHELIGEKLVCELETAKEGGK